MGRRYEWKQSFDWNSEDITLISDKVEYDHSMNDYITSREWTTQQQE